MRGTIGRVLAALVVLLIGAASAARAQGAGITASIDRDRIVQGDQFTYSVEVDGQARDIESPSVLRGGVQSIGSASSSSQMTYINGQMTAKTTYSWAFTAREVGPFTIGPVSATLNGVTVRSNPVEGEVISVPKQNLGTLGNAASARTMREAIDKQLEGRFLAVMEVPQKIYVNQAFPVRTYAYRPADFKPAINGFDIRSLAGGRQFVSIPDGSRLERQLNWEAVEVDGKPFRRALLHTAMLMATRPGKGPVTGSEVLVNFEIDRGGRRDPFFDSFMLNSTSLVQGTMQPPDAEVEVLPIPAAPDAALATLVGNYTVSASLDRPELTEGELLTLTLQVSGQGYLETVSLGQLPPVDGLTFFKEEVEFQVASAGSPFITRKTFKEIYHASKPGKFTFPAMTFAIFNPETGRFQTTATAPLDVTVTQRSSSSVELAAGPSALSRGAARELGGSDILFIDTAPITGRVATGKGRPVMSNPVFWAAHAAALLVAAYAAGWSAYRRHQRSDHESWRARQARGRAQAALREASRHLGNGSRDEFYNALTAGIMNHVGAIVGREASGLTAEEAARILGERGAAAETTASLMALLDHLDAVRYSPEASTSDRDADLNQAREVLRKLEVIRQ
ncbi:BatD family protein [Candidatus Poribacteria bacterium]|nr:BatD family protein [Candidatus Poribacteria bacterium]